MRALFVIALVCICIAGFAQKNDIPTQLTTIDGRTFSIEELHDKVVVLNYWFLACGPCILEIPDLKAVTDEFKDHENLIFIAITPRDDAEQLKFFKRKRDFGYYLIPQNTIWPKTHDISLYPTNIIFKNGKIIYRSNGYNKNIKEELSTQIKSTLGS